MPTLTGHYTLPDGTPASGLVEIIPSEKVILDLDDNVVLSGRVKVTLDPDGAFSVVLPATDDVTLNPTGFGYTVVAKLHHTHLPAVSFSLPASPATVDITEVTTVDPSLFEPGVTYVGLGDLPALVARTVTLTGTGIDATGVTDSTVAIQAKLDAAAGVPVYAPPGTYRVAGLVLRSGVTIIGAGSEQTTFKLPDGGSGDVFVSENFGTLTGGGTNGGVSGVTLSGFTIHGNKAADAAGTWGLRKYGYRWRMEDIVVRDCGGGGIYSEWGVAAGAGADGKFMEDLLENVRVHENAGMGVQWRGPHDSRMEQVLVYANTGIGMSFEGSTTYHSGGIILDGVHVYGNQSHGVQIISSNSNQGASVNASTLVSESNTGTGLILGANGSVISSGNFYNNGGGGIEVKSSAAGYTLQAALQNNTGSQLTLTADGGDATIFVTAYTAQVAQATLTGSPHSSTMLSIVATGLGTLSPRFISPGPITAVNGFTLAAGLAFLADAATLRLPRTSSTNTGYFWYDATGNRLQYRDNLAARNLAYDATASNTQLNSVSDSINTGAKYQGKCVYNTSSNRPVWATGSTAASTWVYADGTTAHTPV